MTPEQPRLEVTFYFHSTSRTQVLNTFIHVDTDTPGISKPGAVGQCGPTYWGKKLAHGQEPTYMCHSLKLGNLRVSNISPAGHQTGDMTQGTPKSLTKCPPARLNCCTCTWYYAALICSTPGTCVEYCSLCINIHVGKGYAVPHE